MEDSQATRDNRANQLNPNNDAYRTSRGVPNQPTNPAQAAADNRANQLNPNNPAYRSSRGKK